MGGGLIVFSILLVWWGTPPVVRDSVSDPYARAWNAVITFARNDVYVLVTFAAVAIVGVLVHNKRTASFRAALVVERSTAKQAIEGMVKLDAFIARTKLDPDLNKAADQIEAHRADIEREMKARFDKEFNETHDMYEKALAERDAEIAVLTARVEEFPKLVKEKMVDYWTANRSFRGFFRGSAPAEYPSRAVPSKDGTVKVHSLFILDNRSPFEIGIRKIVIKWNNAGSISGEYERPDPITLSPGATVPMQIEMKTTDGKIETAVDKRPDMLQVYASGRAIITTEGGDERTVELINASGWIPVIWAGFDV